MSASSIKQVSNRLRAVPGWSRRPQPFFHIPMKAQKPDHHAEIDVRHDQVTLRLTTYDEGGITEKDFSLARQCDEVFSKYFES
jgi:Pterin 4 alpha carbinolamine dehydratase